MTTHNKRAIVSIKEFIDELPIEGTFFVSTIIKTKNIDKDVYSISNILRGNFTNIKSEGRGMWRKIKP
jgi:hypothetical protein